MQNTSPGQRIQQFREHLNLSRKEFTKELGVSQATVSRIEAGLLKPSDVFINAMMGRFLANPIWINTGEGEMLIDTEEYLIKGFRALGLKKIGEGLLKVLNDPEFAEIHGYIELNNIVIEGLDKTIKAYLQHVVELWQQGNEEDRIWLKGQLQRAFPDFYEKKSKEPLINPKDNFDL